MTEQTKWPSNKQTKAVLRQRLIGVGRVHLLSGDHCIHLSVRSSTCPATSHTVVSHLNRAFMSSLSAASKALLPSGAFRSLSAPCGGEGTWILNMLSRCVKSSSQHDANFIKSGVKVRSRESIASFQVKHPMTVCNYIETGIRQAEVKTENSRAPASKLTNNCRVEYIHWHTLPLFFNLTLSWLSRKLNYIYLFSTSTTMSHQKIRTFFGARNYWTEVNLELLSFVPEVRTP